MQFYRDGYHWDGFNKQMIPHADFWMQNLPAYTMAGVEYSWDHTCLLLCDRGFESSNKLVNTEYDADDANL